jgi:hypothetical protein
VRISAPDLARLDGALAGSVLVPGSLGYESARKPALARFHHLRPQAIVRCDNADDVAETLAFARRWGVRAAEQVPIPRREAATPRRRQRWVARRQQRHRPRSPIDRRSPSCRLLPY